MRMQVIGAALLLLPGNLWSQTDTAAAWTPGSRVRTNDRVYIRQDSTPTGTPLRLTGIGDKGTVVRGPWPTPEGWVRWLIHYDTLPQGWSRQRYLTLDSLAGPSPPPGPPPAPPPVFTTVLLDMSPLAMSLRGGEATQVRAFPYDGMHHVTGDTVRWTVLDTARARVLADRVSDFATVTAQRPGSTWVQAHVGSVLGQLRLIVTPPPPPPPAPPPQVVLSVTGVRVTNQPSRPLFHFPAFPLWTGLDSLQLFGGADTTVIAGYARCWITAP